MARRTKQPLALIARTYRIPFDVDEGIAARAEREGIAINTLVITLLQKALADETTQAARPRQAAPANGVPVREIPRW